MKERIAIIDGLRTPFVKSMGAFRNLEADDLGAIVIAELLDRLPIKPEDYDEAIVGNVIGPPQSANVGRVMAMKGGLPKQVPAVTVSRNCASGMEALVIAAERIESGRGEIYMAGGAESMTHVPLTFKEPMRDFLVGFSKAKTFGERLKWLLKLRPSFFSPVIPAINDPLCGLTMGETAEIIAKEFKIDRKAQDEYALRSQNRAAKALKEGLFAQEIVPVIDPKTGKVQATDDGIRDDQTLEQLSRLKPVFLKGVGGVTAGNSSQVTDGACFLVLMKESKAKSHGLKPLGYITHMSVAGLDPSRMGLGPAYAIAKLVKHAGFHLKDYDLIEINEAFAAQILAVKEALCSKEFCEKELGLKEAIGDLNLDRVNVNGGAIALGHPLGASGARITLTLLKELNRRKLKRGLATLCVGGGQGEAIGVEVD